MKTSIYTVCLLFLSTVAQGQDIANDYHIRAELRPTHYTTLAAEFDAVINRIEIAEGQSFKAGQLLISLDCRLREAQMNKAKASLQGAQKILEGNRKLAQFEAIGEVELATSESQVAQAKADVEYLQVLLNKCQIKAPYAGKAGEQHVQEKQFVPAGSPLIDIFADSELQLQFIVPSEYTAWLKPGQGFTITIDERQQRYPAEITRIAARVDPISQTIKVFGHIVGQYPELMAGMSGSVLLLKESE